MTIVVVSSLPGGPTTRPVVQLPATGDAAPPSSGQDFASMLAAVPANAGTAPPAEPQKSASDEQNGDSAPPAVVSDPFLAMLTAPQAALPPAPAAAGSGDEVAMAPETRTTTGLIACPPARAAGEPVTLRAEPEGAPLSVSADSPEPAGPARFAGTQALAAAEGSASEPDSDPATVPGKPGTPLQAALPVPGMSSPQAHAINATIPTALGAPSWAGEFADRLLWFARNERQFAQLSLNPPELGRIDIRLDIGRDAASASFASTSAEVRTAIEAAIPRLREMFASAGIDLGQVAVGGETFRESAQSWREPDPQPRLFRDNAILDGGPGTEPGARSMGTRSGSGLVDLFA